MRRASASSESTGGAVPATERERAYLKQLATRLNESSPLAERLAKIEARLDALEAKVQ